MLLGLHWFKMKTRYWILLVVVISTITYFLGIRGRKVETVTVTVEKQVIKEVVAKNVVKKIKTKETVAKDGTRVIETDSVEEDKSVTSLDKIIMSESSQKRTEGLGLTLSALGVRNLQNGANSVDLVVSKSIFGSLGISASVGSDKRLGCGISVTF